MHFSFLFLSMIRSCFHIANMDSPDLQNTVPKRK